MKAQSLFLVFVLFTNLLRAQQEPALHVAVIAGEGARQVISQKVRIEPAVQVQDESGKSIGRRRGSIHPAHLGTWRHL